MKEQSLQVGQVIEGFTIERVQPVQELRCTAVIFIHKKSGARLLHLVNDDPNNLFSVAFRTPVSDNTGVPHILEHSVLCGSRKFPIKDPFQELLKGSLQTFLNALTYPDKTVYPVSSQVEVDFFNLVDIYCDAVFHPRLTKNTFFQEGWHFDVEDETGPVSIKGIVYNEMKGVFSDFSSHVERRMISHLFPDTSYRFESGGLPEHITDLTYEQFKAFHALYYHPSNAFIFLYGNIPSQKTLAFLDKQYLGEYAAISVASAVSKQPLWSAPRSVSIEAPAPDSDDGFATVALSWLLNHTVDATESLLGSVLYHYLLGTESAPLKRALIDSRLGEDLDDCTGFTTEFVQSVFSVGLRKTKPRHAETIKKLIYDTLTAEVEKGLDEELLEGSLRQIEFRLREISDAGRFPYNLILAERCYRAWIYGGDPLAYLAFEKSTAALRKKKAQGAGYFAQQIKRLFIDNKHNLLTVITASSAMGKKLETQTQQHAEKLSAGFSQEDIRTYHGLTLELMREQKTPNTAEDLATLPKLRKSDLPIKNQVTPVTRAAIAHAPAFLHPLFTSGIAYADIGFDCSGISRELLPFVPLYVELAGRCGAAGLGYEAMAKRTALSTGGIYGSLLCETHAETGNCTFMYFLHGKALNNRVGEMAGIMTDLLTAPDMSNEAQLHDILFEMRNDLNSSVIASGHSFAATHAASKLVLSKHLDEMLDGITQLRFLDTLLKNFKADAIIETMKTIHAQLISANRCMVSITADDPEQATGELGTLVASLPKTTFAATDLTIGQPDRSTLGIAISSSVNFVARAWHCVDFGPVDFGRLLVLSKNLSADYLWNKVRVEGGAYGGMAMVSSGHPVFICASYRDPNLASTLGHFEAGLKAVAAGLDTAAVDQSVIATIGKIDAPRTPHEKGFGETIAQLCGRSVERRQSFRESVLSVTAADLARSSRQILEMYDSATAILGSASALDAAEKEGLSMRREPLV